jgi:hypothetical protein
MRFSFSAVSNLLLLGCLDSISEAKVLHIDHKGPAPTVPLGVSKVPFSKAAGRLFNINGTVEYFAGESLFCVYSRTALTVICPDIRNQFVVASTLEQ